jgi:hypothetical protein
MITRTAAREIANLAINAYLYFETETDTEHAIESAVESVTTDDFFDNQPTIVCLCGSTRFWRTFQQASLRETMQGKIVLSIGAASGTDDEHFGNLSRDEYERVKAMLDELHMRKIDMADEVLILNVEGYIGESTARELAYARRLGKRVRFLEPIE